MAYTAACSGDAALGVGTIDHVDEVDMRVLLPVGLASLANDALDHIVILQLKYVIGLQAAPEAKNDAPRCQTQARTREACCQPGGAQCGEKHHDWPDL